MPLETTWIQLEIIILREVSQREKDKHHMISLICETSNMTQINLSMKQKQNPGHREQICGCQGGRAGGRMDWEFGGSRCKLLYIEWINKKVLMYVAPGIIFYIL